MTHNIVRKSELRTQLVKLSDEGFIAWVQEGHWEILGRGDYHCRNFHIKELVSPSVLEERGETACWALFDVNILVALDWLRATYGSTVINNGLNFTESGYRAKGSDYWSERSMHSVGRAFDCKFRNYTAEEVRDNIKDRIEHGLFVPACIRRVENRVNWFHFDTKWQNYAFRDRWVCDPTGKKRIYLFEV